MQHPPPVHPKGVRRLKVQSGRRTMGISLPPNARDECVPHCCTQCPWQHFTGSRRAVATVPASLAMLLFGARGSTTGLEHSRRGRRHCVRPVCKLPTQCFVRDDLRRGWVSDVLKLWISCFVLRGCTCNRSCSLRMCLWSEPPPLTETAVAYTPTAPRLDNAALAPFPNRKHGIT